MNQKQSFLYVTVISTTPEKLWETLTNPDFIVRYWFGRRNESTWKVGAPIESRSPKGELEWRGRVIENDPPRLLSCAWRRRFYLVRSQRQPDWRASVIVCVGSE